MKKAKFSLFYERIKCRRPAAVNHLMKRSSVELVKSQHLAIQIARKLRNRKLNEDKF